MANNYVSWYNKFVKAGVSANRAAELAQEVMDSQIKIPEYIPYYPNSIPYNPYPWWGIETFPKNDPFRPYRITYNTGVESPKFHIADLGFNEDKSNIE